MALRLDCAPASYRGLYDIGLNLTLPPPLGLQTFPLLPSFLVYILHVPGLIGGFVPFFFLLFAISILLSWLRR